VVIPKQKKSRQTTGRCKREKERMEKKLPEKRKKKNETGPSLHEKGKRIFKELGHFNTENPQARRGTGVWSKKKQRNSTKKRGKKGRGRAKGRLEKKSPIYMPNEPPEKNARHKKKKYQKDNPTMAQRGAKGHKPKVARGAMTFKQDSCEGNNAAKPRKKNPWQEGKRVQRT